MKVKELIRIFSEHYEAEDDVLVFWWDKDVVSERLDDGSDIDPADVWSEVVKTLEENPHLDEYISDEVSSTLISALVSRTGEDNYL